MLLVPKRWAEFQHYKDRSPPWIKLHRDILNNRDFMCLPLASKALAPLLWLLASESKDGKFDADPEELSFRLRMDKTDVISGLKPLIDKGFFLDASTMLAACLPTAITETEGETEVEAETKKKELRKRTPPPEMPEGVDQQTWADWLTLRAKKNAPVTQTVIKSATKEAEKAGMHLEQFLQIWCARGSQGLEAAWLTTAEKRGQQTESFYERDQRLKAEEMAKWAPGVAKKPLNFSNPFEYIDMEQSNVIAIESR